MKAAAVPASSGVARSSGVRLGDLPADYGSGLRFVQDRLALFGKTMFWIAMTFLVLSAGVAIAGAEPPMPPGRESHLVATLIALALWLVSRRAETLPASILHALDAAGTLGISACVVLMGHRLAVNQPWGFFAGTLAVFHTTFARAIVVPSTPGRTLVVSALSFAGPVVSAGFLPPDAGDLPPEAARVLAFVGPITWSATGTALATLASKVIYGLQEQVIRARQLGQYTLEEKIGEGGMGQVYRARHAMLRRPTAIKLLAGEVSETQLIRFEREVQLTALLTHPNTISIYDYGRTPDGTFYYAMELLDGMTLEELVTRHGAQPPARVIHVLRQVCGALREAHCAGLIHRDIKPANIFLCRQGGLLDVVKVLDFGLVKEISDGGDPALTGMNMIIGTPLYLAPESIRSPDAVDARSDLYALGAVGYFMLSGAPVFIGQSVVEVCSQHLHAAPPPPSTRTTASIPADLERIVLDCLAKDPAERPSSAELLAQRLERCAQAAAWSQADAAAFWQSHGQERRPRVDDLAPEQRSMPVDLGARRIERG